MRMSTELFLMIALDIAMALQLFGLWIAVMIDDYISETRRKQMLAIIYVVALLILQGHFDFYFNYDTMPVFVHKLNSVVGYSLRPVVISLFIFIQGATKHRKFLWTVVIVNMVIHMTTFFSNICFGFLEDGSFIRGPLGYTSFVVSGLLLGYLVVNGFLLFGVQKKSDYVIPLFVSVFVVFATVADVMMVVDSPVSFLMVSMVAACVFYYIWLHISFIREHEKEIEAGQRIRIMVSQIQPHFLFNTLATVQALCHTDPDMASDTLEKFSIYLRQNMDSLDKPDLIPFSRELEHTKVYAQIEQIRFPSIEITYDIEVDDFMLPALTIQPLVENAIRHGVRIREHGRISVHVKDMHSSIRIIIKCNNS